jgi:hypothetical protein
MTDRFSGRLAHWLVNTLPWSAVKEEKNSNKRGHNDDCEEGTTVK